MQWPSCESPEAIITDASECIRKTIATDASVSANAETTSANARGPKPTSADVARQKHAEESGRPKRVDRL